MHFYIETLKQRLDAINQLRVDRALAAMGPGFQHVYILLPTLLHLHHPMLPGYLDGNVPHGICFYSLNKIQRAWLDNIGRQVCAVVTESDSGEQPITGVYSMGSTSTIGQNANSDFDIWVCHQPWLDNEERAQLQRKCHLLKRWATRHGVDVNFFLIDEYRFRHNKSSNLSEEDYGSTQHILLLDEFYRTAVRMGGKRILWNMVPGDEEAHYDEYVLSLYTHGALIPNEWLDLGGLGTLSVEEYFSASLWQLYKSIDSPYKAVLKTLLLEVYSWEYPHTKLLAMKIKQRLHDGEIVSFGLDSYCMMLERVTYYLTQINDMTRLDLVRRCFYLKVCEKLSQDTTGTPWRREILTQLVTSWGWDEARLKVLDDRSNWKISQVREAYNELLDAMIQSYRNLIQFTYRNNLNISVNLQDIGVLIRKLHAAFEALPGKVILLNPQISSNLSEPRLTLIYVSQGRINHTGWYLYNQLLLMDSIISNYLLEYNYYLNKLEAWPWFNGLLTSLTQVHAKDSDISDSAKLNKFITDMVGRFPLCMPTLTLKTLYSLCEICNLAMIINLEYNSTVEFRNQMAYFHFCKLDVFSFGQQWYLVDGIDLLCCNSWNEMRTPYFSSEQVMMEVLKIILGKMYQDAALLDMVEVLCCSQHLCELIYIRVQQLIYECIKLCFSNTS